MKKKSLILLIIYTLSFQQSLIANSTTLNNKIDYKDNLYATGTNIEKPRDKEKIDFFWSSQNESLLTSEEKETLSSIRAKVDSGKPLTVEERAILSTLRGETIRKKIGDVNFERYKKLIEKREKQEKGTLEIEMTKEEKREIYYFEKEIHAK